MRRNENFEMYGVLINMVKRLTEMPSQKSLKKILSEAAFNPRASQGPMAIIVGMKDTRYLENKMIELITEAKALAGRVRLLYMAEQVDSNEVTRLMEEYKDKMQQVLGLGALSIAFKESGLIEGA